MHNSTITIGIAGASGSGKSLLAKNVRLKLRELCPDLTVEILNEDCYYLRRDNISFAERELINYDHPESLEHDLLVEHLIASRNGQRVEVPMYNYATHNRRSETTTMGAFDILIVEGILILHTQEIREQLDLCVYVDVPIETCLERRLKRDMEERGRSRESVMEQFEVTVVPMYQKYIEPSRKWANQVAVGGGDNNDAIDSICKFVSNFGNTIDSDDDIH